MDILLLKTDQYQTVFDWCRLLHPVLSQVNKQMAAQGLPQGIQHPKAAPCTVSARRLQSWAHQALARNRSSMHTPLQYH